MPLLRVDPLYLRVLQARGHLALARGSHLPTLRVGEISEHEITEVKKDV